MYKTRLFTFTTFLVIFALCIPLNVQAKTEYIESESVSSLELVSIDVSKEKVPLEEASTETYMNKISTTVKRKVGKWKKNYYAKERTTKIITKNKYEKYYKGKDYKYVFTKTFIQHEVSFYPTGKKDLSPKIKKKIGQGLSNAFSKRGYKINYSAMETVKFSIMNKKINCSSEKELIRQMGEFLSLLNNNFCYTSRFRKIYKEERGNFFGEIKRDCFGVEEDISSLNIYFGRCYELYLSSPREMKNLMPKTYIAIDDCVKAINKKYLK